MFHYDYTGNLIAETDGNGNPQRDYIYLNGEPVAMRIYAAFQFPPYPDNPFVGLANSLSQPGMFYFLNDHLGTPQKIVNASGNLVWQAVYQPFGEAQLRMAIVSCNLRFPGQYFDSETGLHYNWNRYYDPETGRYITADPIGLSGGINLYAYVGGNPVNGVDPFGLMGCVIPRRPQSIDSSCNPNNAGIQSAIALVNLAILSNCIGSQSLKDKLLDKIIHLQIVCPNISGCGEAAAIFSDTIKLSPSSFNPALCGPLESTILHEMGHSVGKWGETVPEACEASCFGWNPRNANPADCR